MSYSKEIDKKWRKKWNESHLYKFNKDNIKKKLYCLEMLPYPSGSVLHLGHWFNFGLCDSWARMKKMQGFEVYEPMGFDAFGLPAENYAIKTGVHPKDSTMQNINNMKRQLSEMGAMFNNEHDLITCLPEYYKWTQWLFLQLYKNNLAYRKEAPVNWCPACKTVLANEQVVNGQCERCHSDVIKKDLTQWFFKITHYAEELLEKLDDLDWPEATKKKQKNWIGKSKGHEFVFKIKNSEKTFTIFTTRADTLFGVSYCVLAPENKLVKEITTKEYEDSVNKYIEETKKKNEIERLSTDSEKTGTFTGAYAINPINNEEIPIWISDYVLASYGTGCVMAVPAHDERDYLFAKKYNLPIKTCIVPQGNDSPELPFTDYGILINSQGFNGLSSDEAKVKIAESLNDLCQEKINYRLRDWLVSRQRYWGAPIPVIHCPTCGIVPVDEKDLPVLLPYNVEFKPDGESPLKKCEEFINTKCPICGNDAKRDPDTLDTFVCSSWYYLRYPDSNNDKEIFNSDLINEMLPVDKYIGGPEHAVLHLLYSRFITKALRDMGKLNFDEPFKSLVHQGLILGSDGTKMSKSKGNTVSPDEYIDKYGSDVFRLYLMFGFDYTEGGPWSDSGIKAISKFVKRIEGLVERFHDKGFKSYEEMTKFENDLIYKKNETIKGVINDADRFSFNTSVAKLMEFLNAINEYERNEYLNEKVYKSCIETLILLIAPFAPHFGEEMWEVLGNEYSVFNQEYPTWENITRDEIEIAIQINGSVKSKVVIPTNITNDEIKEIVLSNDKVKSLIGNKSIVKVIVVPKRLVNLVIR